MSRPHRVDGPHDNESTPSFVFSAAPIGGPVFSALAGCPSWLLLGVQIADIGCHLAEQSADRTDENDDDRTDCQCDERYIAQNVGGAKSDHAAGPADDRTAERALGIAFCEVARVEQS